MSYNNSDDTFNNGNKQNGRELIETWLVSKTNDLFQPSGDRLGVYEPIRAELLFTLIATQNIFTSKMVMNWSILYHSQSDYCIKKA